MFSFLVRKAREVLPVTTAELLALLGKIAAAETYVVVQGHVTRREVRLLTELEERGWIASSPICSPVPAFRITATSQGLGALAAKDAVTPSA